MQTHGRIAQTLFNLLDALTKLDLWIARTEVPDSFGVHEDDLLLTVCEQPENKVGVKVSSFEEAQAAAPAEIP